FSLRDPYKQLEGPYDYIATAEVKDPSNQVVSKRAIVTAHPTDFYLGMHSQEAVQAVDMPFAINAVAISPTGKRVAAKATLQLIRQDWHCTHKGGYRSYQDCKSTDVPVLERDFDIPRAGSSVQRIVPKQPGEYVVRIDSVDSQGRRVSSSSWVWVLGKGQAFWSGDESARLTLIANKARYQPGDTAKLVPRTGMKSPTALITIERDGVIEAKVRQLDSAAQGLEVPLQGNYAPNVYASVALVTGRRGKGDRNRPRFKMGVVDLPVSADRNRLEVEVDTDKKSYEPGQTVRGTIRVTSNGKPIRAEVALSVADEGVLQLIAYKTPDPMKSFYASFGLGLDSATNLNRIARLNDPLGYDADEGGDAGSDKDPIRSKFVSSAHWAPELYTGGDGRVAFEFQAPDNLTAFRLMAVAADKGQRFGSGDDRVRIAKKVMAKPMLPRFLTAGDEALVGVVIHNRTGKAGKATVSVKGKGVRFARSRQVVSVNKTRRVVFPITALDRNQATFTFKVEMPGGRDALRKSIKINRGLHYDQRTLAEGVLESTTLARIRVPLQLSSAAIARESKVSVSIDRTGLAELEPALAYLVEYPYGCLEQTLSRFVPLAKVKDLASSVGMKQLDGPKMNTFLRVGAAKVARHQQGNGHFSLWPNGQTYPHLTVYAVHGLLEAKRAGVSIDEVALGRGLTALARWANRPSNQKPGGDSATAAMAAYVLADAGKADPGLIARLFKARSGLPVYGKAFLLKAMTRARSPQADINRLKQELMRGLVRKGGALMVDDKLTNASLYMSSNTRSTAMV
ncbi:MAG: hypothetical protein KJO07_02335, partial [Deltaproteobacteria bacterium]|nr:hypothetical protein [Deltaproteobacteria bacterium]